VTFSKFPVSIRELLKADKLSKGEEFRKEDFIMQEGAIAVREVAGNKAVPNIRGMPRETLDVLNRPMSDSHEKRRNNPGNSCLRAVRLRNYVVMPGNYVD
jgi:hypothetical protein